MSERTRLPLLILLCMGSVSPAAEPKPDRSGDPLPEGAIARLGSLHWRHEAAIHTAAFTPDGKSLATCHAESISFWDLDTGKCVRRVPLKRGTSWSLRRLSDDGKVLMLGGHNNVLHFLDAASGVEQGTLNHAQCGAIWGWPYLSRDGKILAAVHRTSAAMHQASIVLWDVAEGKLLHEFKEPALERVAPHGLIALTPDGKQLVLPHADGSLHVVDVASGKEVRAIEMPPPRQGAPSSFPFSTLALSPDGRYLAFNGWATPLTVCELATGKRLHRLGSSQGSFPRMAFTPNGRFLAVDMFNEIRLFGVLSGKEIRKLPKKKPVPSVMLVFSPDGRTLAAFPSAAPIQLWDVVAQRRLHPPVGHEADIRALAFFPDGHRLVSADRTGELRVWDIASGQTLAEQTYNYGAVSLTVDGDGETVRFAGNDSSVHQWDFRTGREQVQPKVMDGLYTTSLALSPDGRSLAILVPNRGTPQKQPVTFELRLHDFKTNQSIVLPRPSEQRGVDQLTFTSDSRRLAVSFPDGVMRLWDRDTGKLVREVPSIKLDGPPIHLTFAADGRSFLALMRNTIRIRELASGVDRLQIPPAHGVFSLVYSPDARFIASGQGDGQIFVYSAVSGKQLAQWQGKQGYVFALAFSRDSRFLASGGQNGTILVWKVPQDETVPVVRTAEEADSLWQALGNSDGATANRALAGLAAAPAQALPLFRKRLPALGRELDRTELARWIAKLDDESFQVREQATRELAKAGEDAADVLRHALNNSPSAESKRRMEDLLSRLKEGSDSRRLRFLRALEALERIGTPPAKELLRELARKPMSVELKEEVQASLRRLGDKP